MGFQRRSLPAAAPIAVIVVGAAMLSVGATQSLQISRADLSAESITTLRQVTDIRNVRNLMRGSLIFGSVTSLLGTGGAGIAALLNASDLDSNIRAVDAVGVIAACRVAQTVALRILDASGAAAPSPWTSRVEERYFGELLRQSEAACRR